MDGGLFPGFLTPWNSGRQPRDPREPGQALRSAAEGGTKQGQLSTKIEFFPLPQAPLCLCAALLLILFLFQMLQFYSSWIFCINSEFSKRGH